jgi:hypothetical protein
MPMPSMLHKWLLKKMPCPPSMTKSQYLANIGQSLLLKTGQYFWNKNVFMELAKLALKTSFLHIMLLIELFKIPFLFKTISDQLPFLSNY